MRKSYRERLYLHAGWESEKEESDFIAYWGTIYRRTIMDFRNSDLSLQAASDECRRQRASYFLFHTESAHGTRLYRSYSSAPPKCVNGLLISKERNRVKQLKQYEGIETRIKQILRVAKQRCESFSLDFDAVMARVHEGRCEATGMALNLVEVGSPFAPSLDRINPEGGYTPENVWIVCAMFNQMKMHWPMDDVLEFVRHLCDQGGLSPRKPAM